MNYNTNSNIPNPGIVRKPKRVSDVNAMGMPTSGPPTANYALTNDNSPIMDPMMTPAMPESNINYNFPGAMPPQQTHTANVPTYPNVAMPQNVGNMPNQFAPIANQFPQFSMFQEPAVQGMALQYGQQLADHGKKLVENQFSKWVPISKLQYYFAVDNNYVINKLRLIFFPFVHKEWALKYDHENPVQPRYDINAPDLYIPTMAFITYVVTAGLMLGLQNRFTPEKLSMQASSALAYSIFELIVYSVTLYVVNIKTSLKTLDLLAFAGYKFVTIVTCLLISILFHGFGYYMALSYCTLSLGFFLLRTLKTKVLDKAGSTNSTTTINYDPYGNPHQLDYVGGRKRKLYFLFLLVGSQALISLLLSKHLYFSKALQQQQQQQTMNIPS